MTADKSYNEVYGATSVGSMSVRDYLAGQVAAGIAGECLRGSGMVNDKARSATIAAIAYSIADAMLEARRRQR